MARTWTRFEKVERDFAKMMKVYSEEEWKLWLEVYKKGCEGFWQNNLYTVTVTSGEAVPVASEFHPMVWLSIRRLERARLPRDWRDLQRIKNELVGPDHEGCELFPAERRLVDESDQFHLWVFEDPKAGFPFGYIDRRVGDEAPHGSQRPREFTTHHEPVGIENLTPDLARRIGGNNDS